jgi:hypothetical protein
MSSPIGWIAIGVILGVLATLLVMRSLRPAPSVTASFARAPIVPRASLRSDAAEIVDLR